MIRSIKHKSRSAEAKTMKTSYRLGKTAAVSLLIGIVGLGINGQSFAAPPNSLTAGTDAAASAVNALGMDLLKQGVPPTENALISPYSIQSALAMTYAGADGDTKDEMTKTLHFSGDEEQLHADFAALQTALAEVARKTTQHAEQEKAKGEAADPVILTVANRLFGDKSYEFLQPFMNRVKDSYHAPFELMDFRGASEPSRIAINEWVAEQTQKRILDLIPGGGIDESTRLVLVNAIFLKAPWAMPFKAEASKPAPFYVNGGTPKNVPTMTNRDSYGYARRDGYTAVAIPYYGGDLQFLVLLPDEMNGLAELEKKLTPEALTSCAQLKSTDVVLHLPKLKLEPPLLKLSDALKSLGMRQAFSREPGLANFTRMALPQQGGNLAIAEVFHKTFLKLDEKGTEFERWRDWAAMRSAVIASLHFSYPIASSEKQMGRVLCGCFRGCPGHGT